VSAPVSVKATTTYRGSNLRAWFGSDRTERRSLFCSALRDNCRDLRCRGSMTVHTSWHRAHERPHSGQHARHEPTAATSPAEYPVESDRALRQSVEPGQPHRLMPPVMSLFYRRARAAWAASPSPRRRRKAAGRQRSPTGDLPDIPRGAAPGGATVVQVNSRDRKDRGGLPFVGARICAHKRAIRLWECSSSLHLYRWALLLQDGRVVGGVSVLGVRPMRRRCSTPRTRSVPA
jgi:hypothetical protein